MIHFEVLYAHIIYIGTHILEAWIAYICILMLSAALHRISALQPRFIAPMSTSRILAIRAIEVKTHTYGIITSSQNTYINHFRIHTRFNRCTSEIHMYQLQSIRRLSVLRHHRIKDTSGVGFDNPIECLRVDNTGMTHMK